ncbi:MAG TPA: XRE family transcriptional regulator [Spirochaetota bacterium]|nr:XRE family transcriptional regulator [Spirochaetota bacterium]
MRKTPTAKGGSLGRAVRSRREKLKLGVEELAARTGLTEAHISDIEEGRGFAPVGDILKIARVLTIDPGELLKKKPADAREQVKTRIRDFKSREQAYEYEVLTPDALKGHLRSFRVTIPPRSDLPGQRYQHEGEEFVYVLKGEVVIRVGQKDHHLKKDDTLHFDSNIRHSLRNPGGAKTVLIVTLFTP